LAEQIAAKGFACEVVYRFVDSHLRRASRPVFRPARWIARSSSRRSPRIPADPVVDELDAAGSSSSLALPAPRTARWPEPVSEAGVWFLYPWARRLVGFLPEPLHRELRFARTATAITAGRIRPRLTGLPISVAGLSVGRAGVSTLVARGPRRELRPGRLLRDHLSNLTVPAAGRRLGCYKVCSPLARWAELDPYVRVALFPRGVEEGDGGDEFVSCADVVVVDDCDGLESSCCCCASARRGRALPW